MSKMTLTLGATTLVGAIVSAHLWQGLSTANAQARSLQGQLAAVGALDRSQPTTVAVVGSHPASATALPITARDAQAHSGQPGSDTARTGNSVFSGSMEKMLGDPAVRQSMASSIRASLPQRYPFLGEELNLAPEQLGKLYDQLTENQLATLETPGANADPNRRLMIGQAREDRLAAVLGPTAYGQWKEYNETLDLRQQIGRLHTTLETSAQPLSDTQRRQLTTALVAYHKQLKQEDAQAARPAVALSDADKTAIVMERMRIARENNQKLRDMATSYLTPEQLDAFGRMQNQESDLTLAMLRAQPGQQQR